jgi:hypothetical protein
MNLRSLYLMHIRDAQSWEKLHHKYMINSRNGFIGFLIFDKISKLISTGSMSKGSKEFSEFPIAVSTKLMVYEPKWEIWDAEGYKCEPFL